MISSCSLKTAIPRGTYPRAFSDLPLLSELPQEAFDGPGSRLGDKPAA